MALTVTQCADWIKLTLGNNPGAPLSTLEIVNQAGRHLVTMRAWKWLEGRTATLDTVAAQDYADLPADFGEPIALEVADRSYSVTWVTRQRLDCLRAAGNESGSIFSVFVSTRAADEETPPTPVLELSPPAPTTTVGYFNLSYRATWADLTSDQDYVPISPICDTLYKRLLQVFARGYTREEQGSLDQRLVEIATGPVFRNAIRDDRRKQTDYGRIRGAISEYSTEPFRLPTTITGP